MNVSHKNILRRLRRKLKQRDEILRKSRHYDPSIGEYVVINTWRNRIVRKHVDPVALARELGVLQDYETAGE